MLGKNQSGSKNQAPMSIQSHLQEQQRHETTKDQGQQTTFTSFLLVTLIHLT